MKESNMFISMHKTPFGRRGAFMTFYLDDLSEETFGMPRLWFGSTRGGASIQGRNYLMKLSPIWNGEEIPYALSSTPAELILDSDHGTIRICIGEEKLVRIHSEGEVGLRFFWDICGKHTSGKHEDARDMMDGTWQACFNWIANFLFVPIDANMECEAPWNWRETYSEYFKCDFTPKDNRNIMEIAIEEFPDFNGKKRESYPTYEECVAKVEAEFKEFLDTTVPEIKDPYLLKLREQAAWISWNHLIGPEKLIKRPMMQMMRVYFPYSFGWQQSYQAATFIRDMDLAWDLLQTMFDHQTEDGHIPEYVTDFYKHHRITKPPFQGFVVLWIMKHGDMSKISKERIEELYHPLCRWTEWWLENRCPTGIPQYDHADESGWDDATVYIKPCPCISPELPCYLILQMEAQAKMAEMIGLADDAKKWYARAKEMLDLTLERLWNGERFVAIRPTENEIIEANNMVCYQPLILGKRLPQDIIDKLVADLKVEGDYLTPYGFASERLDSPYVDPFQGWMNGPIVAPLMFQMVIGLDECGEKEFAREVAYRFCKNCVDNGAYHIINPFNGRGQDKGRDNVIHQHCSSWSTSAFLFLAGFYC
jgi:putative isomerase